MPARTGHSTYIPGRGTTTRSKGGKAKSFQGSGPAPAGTKREPEASYLTAPTLTVQNGKVTASGFKSRAAQRKAVKRQQLRSFVHRNQATRKQQGQASAKRLQQTERAVKAAKPTTSAPKAQIAAPPAKLKQIQQANRANAKEFAAERTLTPPPVKHPAAVKRVKRQLAQAKAGAQHLVGDLGPEQRRFIKGVSKRTRLNPRVIAAQARAEEGSGSQTEAERSHNFLNMGPGIKYPTLKAGIEATAANYNDTTSPNYAGVRAARGKGAKAQAAAIVASPWGTTSLIEKTLPEIGLKGKPIPKALIAKAKKLGINPKTPSVGKPSKQVVTRYKAAEGAARQLEKLHLPYVWGGGHNAGSVNLGSGVDCSGAVSYVLQKMGVKLPGGVVSGDMGSYLKPGPGAVTVFYNPEHTFMRIGNHYFGTSGSNPGGGAGFIENAVAGPEAVSGKYSVGHVAGLGQKVAVQLGVPTFPGMTVSPARATATINPGEGATVGSPGFSAKPIRLTPTQKRRRTFKRLKEVGIGTPAEPKEAGTSLKALERKYGVRT